MGYEYDMREELNEKLRVANNLISIIKKLDPDLLKRAKRIASGKEKLPDNNNQANKTYSDLLIESESAKGIKVTKALVNKMKKANNEFLDRHPSLKKTFNKK